MNWRSKCGEYEDFVFFFGSTRITRKIGMRSKCGEELVKNVANLYTQKLIFQKYKSRYY